MTLQHPSNRIVVQGSPLVHHFTVETVTNMYPGRLVKKDTADHQIEVCGAAGACIGWLGYEQCNNESNKPDTVDTIWTAVEAPVLYGGGFVIVGSLASGDNVTLGARLTVAANGQLTEADAATVTIASGSTAVTSDKAQPDESVVGAYGSQGIVVAIAMEDKDASGGAADIAVLSLI